MSKHVLKRSLKSLTFLPIFTFLNAVNKANFNKEVELFLNDELVGLENYKYLIESAKSDFDDKEIV